MLRPSIVKDQIGGFDAFVLVFDANEKDQVAAAKAAATAALGVFNKTDDSETKANYDSFIRTNFGK